MALNAYLTLKGQKQGDIKGSVTQKGREGKIMVIAVSHEIISPRDTVSGQATGKRQHKPLVITKEVDRSSPLLQSALVNNENIPSWTLEFWTSQVSSAAGVGVENQHYTIELVNANITSISFRMLNTKDPELTRYAEHEEIAFAYQKITWTWKDGGITASDDWSSRT